MNCHFSLKRKSRTKRLNSLPVCYQSSLSVKIISIKDNINETVEQEHLQHGIGLNGL